MKKMPLGRIHQPDERDHQYLMHRHLAAPATPLPIKRSWQIGAKSLDQGNTSACVGHGWKNFLRCAPMQTEAGPSQWDIYRYAVAHDQFKTNDNEANLPDGDRKMKGGTTVRAGAAALVAQGRLASYLWAFDARTIIEWLLTKGPVVMGTNWYESMFEPDDKGIAHISPGSSPAGGHCYLLRGADQEHAIVRAENSWGDDWGVNGGFFLTFRDLERLTYDGGECCTAVEQKVAPVAPNT